jgi:hypothetical protein
VKFLELKGVKSLRALNVFQQLMLGVKMLPEFADEEFEKFYVRVQGLPEKEQEKLIRTAIHFVPVEAEDLQALFTFCADPNGVPFSSENIKNLAPGEMIEMIVGVCKEIAKVKIYFLSEDEKKN